MKILFAFLLVKSCCCRSNNRKSFAEMANTKMRGKNMKAMICEMCGNNDLVKTDGMFVCRFCGTKYTIEEAKKLLGTVKIDKSEETEKLLILARRAREEDNSENAEKYYNLVLQEEPNNWEAMFFQVYYQAMQCKVGEIPSATISIRNSIVSTMKTIAEMQDVAAKNEALGTVLTYSGKVALMFAMVTENTMKKYITVNTLTTCKVNIATIKTIHEKIEESLKRYLPAEYGWLVNAQKSQVTYMFGFSQYFDENYFVNERNRLEWEIRAIDPSYTAPRHQVSQQSGCYVATAVYGSYDCPQVWTLRRFRDYTLSETWYGRAFIRTYYAISPTLVKWFGETAWFKNMWKPTLDRMVEHLNSEGVENTPYNDRNW